MRCVQKRVHARNLKCNPPVLPQLLRRRTVAKLRKAIDRLSPAKREEVVSYLLDCAPEPCRWLVGEYLACFAGR
jgi:hypothetical protein